MLRKSARRLRRSGLTSLESRVLPAAVLITSSPGPNGTVNLNFEGTAGDDSFLVGKQSLFGSMDGTIHVYSFFGTTFRLNGGEETGDLVVGNLGNLTFNLGGGNDSAWLFDLEARNVTIHDGVTDDESNSYKIDRAFSNTKLGNIQANFNRGRADLQFSAVSYADLMGTVFDGGTMEIGSVTVKSAMTQSTQVGLTSFPGAKFTVTGLVSFESLGGSSDAFTSTTVGNSFQPPTSTILKGGVRVNTGGGGDFVRFDGNLQVQGKVDVDTGSDGSTVSFGGSAVFKDKVTVVGGASNDTISFSIGSPVFHDKVTFDTRAGDDVVHLQKFDPSQGTVHFKKNVSIATGDQNDMVLMSQVNIGGALTIDLGNGQLGGMFDGDHINLMNSVVDGNTRVTSAGKAIIAISSTPGSEMRFRGDVAFTLGAGDIYLNTVTMEKAQAFTGRPNLIRVSYGNVTADLTKRRLVNAELI